MSEQTAQTTAELWGAADAFTRAYVECALRSSMDESEEGDGEPLDRKYSPLDLTAESLAHMAADCADFLRQVLERHPLLSEEVLRQYARAGADFWLTRNRHGAGFWDGDYPEAIGRELTDMAHVYGESDLTVGDDGRLYVYSSN